MGDHRISGTARRRPILQGLACKAEFMVNGLLLLPLVSPVFGRSFKISLKIKFARRFCHNSKKACYYVAKDRSKFKPPVILGF